MDYLFSVVLFAISSTITPGPNNIMVMTSGLNFGVRRTLPLLSGICIGFTIMLLMVGLGFSQLFVVFPNLDLTIKVIGTTYLFYLAWQIASANGAANAKLQPQPIGFLKGALFQWVNAKAWVVAIGAISAFTTVGDSFFVQNITISSTFFIVSFPCVGVWLIFGTLLRKFLENPVYLRAFNVTMALLLVSSMQPVLKEIWLQF